MNWFFFILLNATFFIRPADLVQSADLPLYNILMIACLSVSGGRVLGVIANRPRSPVTMCVLGVVLACVLSHLTRAALRSAAEDGFYILKIITYYLVMVAVVVTPARMVSLLRWLVCFTVVLTGLALAHYHGFISLESLEACQQNDIDPATGEVYVIPRLVSTGVFNDPNDLSMICVFAIIICLFFAERTRGFGRFCWLAPVGFFAYGLKLTYSRGGLLNLGFSLMVLSWCRLGWKKTVVAGALALPAVLAIFGGSRMTNIDLSDSQNTSQSRIQLWSEGLGMFRERPLFGVGMNEYADRAGLVAHNSYVHAYGELGFFGGTLFLGAFYSAVLGVWKLYNPDVEFYDPAIKQLRPYVLAMICSYCVGMFSLSRCYTVTTYTMLGISASYLQVAKTWTSEPGVAFDSRFIQRLVVVGLAGIAFLYIFVRLTVRWN
jgi:O-Antigen ligase